MRVLSVSQINFFIKSLIEGDGRMRDIYARGEISNFTDHYRSGHLYFSLKDEKSVLKAVMFSSAARRLRFCPKEGMRVIVRGRVAVYEPGGQYQFYVEEMQPDGVGALSLAFEQLKEKLAAEGLFAEEHKRPIPPFPARIGVITSPTGAAVQDIRNILSRRWPAAEIVFCPVLVQGSAEDLAAFNDETLARAVFASKIPVISAVGHETDFTICDFVADLRAPTPSAAAELAVPDREEMRAALAQLTRRLCGSVQAGLDDRRQMLDALASANVLQNPSAWLSPRRQALRNTVQSLTHSAERRILNEKNELAALSARLDAMSPLKVLSRGYAIVSDENGKVIKRTEDAKPGDVLTARVEDGAITVRVQKTEKREMTDA